ncbi:MAG: mechanosensitive ion channel family protein [Bradymonadaceae bacterium]
MSLFDDWFQTSRRYAVALIIGVVSLMPTVLAAQESTNAGAEESSGPLPPWTEVLDSLLNLDVGNIPLWRLLAAVLLIIVGISLRRFLLAKILSPLERLLDKTDTEHDDQLLKAVDRPLGWIVNLVAIYLALLVLDLPEPLVRTVSLILQTIGTVMVAWTLNKFVDVVVGVMTDFAQGTESEIDDYLVPVIGRVVRVALFVMVGIVIIQQWGYDVTSLLAGLGIGGLAFALAAKPTLANWFGSIMIFTDRPFTIGDRINIDAGNGVVEEVGLRSTRIRTREDSLITIPNADIASKPIDNLSARRRRRIKTTVGVVYDTTADQIREIVEGIRRELADHDEISDEDRIVRFSNFGGSALKIFVECYARTTGRGDYYRIREEIHFLVADVVEAAGSSFAFPSQSVYMQTPVEVTGED